MLQLFLLFWVLVREVVLLRGDLWEQDLSSTMKIGLSMSGYKSVDLRCDFEHFDVNVTVDEDFQGVVYTRGSFSKKNLPCFKRHDQNSFREGKKLLIGVRIPFHKCGSVMDVSESIYTNILLVQHDPDLIMPGDAAFRLDCAFEPEVRVRSDDSIMESTFRSKITLVDADPSAEIASPATENLTAFSKSEKVTFVPDSGDSDERINDEL